MVDSKWLEILERDTNGLTKAVSTQEEETVIKCFHVCQVQLTYIHLYLYFTGKHLECRNCGINSRNVESAYLGHICSVICGEILCDGPCHWDLFLVGLSWGHTPRASLVSSYNVQKQILANDHMNDRFEKCIK